MIVVSDTTPINYLVLIDAIGILPKLFDEVYAPSAVMRELAHAKTPDVVRQFADMPPAWLRVADPASRLPSTARLDDAEADAISLAKERGIRDVLIDEYLGRKVAVAEGLLPLPTLAVIERAARRGLLELRPVLEALQRTTYRVRPELIQAVLDREAARKKSEGH
jgi:predicted nucleic acid-binding protein